MVAQLRDLGVEADSVLLVHAAFSKVRPVEGGPRGLIAALLAAGRQRHCIVGHAEARLVGSRDIVAAATARLRADETIVLHPFGVDEECDDARRSLTTEANLTSG